MINVKFTNGFGNNLFQYIYARMIAEITHKGFSVNTTLAPYAKNQFKILGIDLLEQTKGNFSEVYENEYFEDWIMYYPFIKYIQNWFASIERTNTKDLVFHLRLGDRLFLDATYELGMYVSPESYVKAIKQFDFEILHIVTDMPYYGIIEEQRLDGMVFHTNVDKTPEKLKRAVEYNNSIVSALKQFHPVVVNHKNVALDFNFIRKFNQVLFQHSTMAWWAAVISGAEKVGVYGPWRPAKGENNKNLSQVPLPGWFQWE